MNFYNIILFYILFLEIIIWIVKVFDVFKNDIVLFFEIWYFKKKYGYDGWIKKCEMN